MHFAVNCYKLIIIFKTVREYLFKEVMEVYNSALKWSLVTEHF